MLDRGLQFAAEMTKELNKILGIETKFLTSFHPQTDSQTKNELGTGTISEILYRS